MLWALTLVQYIPSRKDAQSSNFFIIVIKLEKFRIALN